MRSASITSAHGCSTSRRRRREALADVLATELPNVVWDVADGSGFFDASAESIADAAARAREADVVVLAIGEPSRISGEASSRADITLPAAQRRLIHAVADTGARIVVVLATGRPLIVEDWIDRVAAVLCVWHLGTEAPAAIAAVISGRSSPGGRLPMTFPRAVGQIPIHYDHETTGRPPRLGGGLQPETAVQFQGPNNTDDYYTSKYIDLPLGPRFDFGHGLSYTTFKLSDLVVFPPTTAASDARIEVAVTVSNTGDRAADDVVMLFVTDVIASMTQPVRRLRGFERIAVAAGSSASVTFDLMRDDLSYWADADTRVFEPGEFVIAVSDGSSELSAPLVVEGAADARPAVRA